MTRSEYLKLLLKCCDDGTFPSVDRYSNCLYRGPGGKKCAAGVLIPDEKYEPCFEGRSASSSNIVAAVEMPSGVSVDQLSCCQSAHDKAARGSMGESFKGGFLRRLVEYGAFTREELETALKG